jgi:acetolactate synthase-1/2/3 large subunit
VDIDQAAHNKVVNVALPIVGDAGNFLQQLNGLLTRNLKIADWHKHLTALKKQYPLGIPPHKKYVTPQQVIEEINVQTKGQAVITTDVGAHQMWAAQYLQHLHPKKWLSSGGLGTMGYGFPAAIGAWFGAPKDDVICISGDGSFQMCIQELGTAIAYDVPVKVFILNNNFLGMVRQWQEFFYEKRYSGVEWGDKPVDFVKVSEAYGALGLRVTKPGDIKKTIAKALAYKGPVVVDFVIRPEESVFPMVPQGSPIDKMLFGDQFEDEM